MDTEISINSSYQKIIENIASLNFLKKGLEINSNVINNQNLQEYVWSNFPKEVKEIGANSIQELLFLYKQNILTPPKCSICNSQAFFNVRKYKYLKTCGSHNCAIKLRNLTNLEKYGGYSPMASQEVRNKWEENYINKTGVSNPSQLKENLIKREETYLKKSNNLYRYAAQDPSTRKKTIYSYNNTKFDSKEELSLYIFYKDKGMDIERNKEPLLYKDPNNKDCFYYPDFKTNKGFIECKGDYLISNSGTWVPSGLSLSKCKTKKQKDFLYKKYVLKQECAIKNNVIILTEKDIQEYMNYCSIKFNKKTWYRDFNIHFKKKHQYISTDASLK